MKMKLMALAMVSVALPMAGVNTALTINNYSGFGPGNPASAGTTIDWRNFCIVSYPGNNILMAPANHDQFNFSTDWNTGYLNQSNCKNPNSSVNTNTSGSGFSSDIHSFSDIAKSHSCISLYKAGQPARPNDPCYRIDITPYTYVPPYGPYNPYSNPPTGLLGVGSTSAPTKPAWSTPAPPSDGGGDDSSDGGGGYATPDAGDDSPASDSGATADCGGNC